MKTQKEGRGRVHEHEGRNAEWVERAGGNQDVMSARTFSFLQAEEEVVDRHVTTGGSGGACCRRYLKEIDHMFVFVRVQLVAPVA